VWQGVCWRFERFRAHRHPLRGRAVRTDSKAAGAQPAQLQAKPVTRGEGTRAEAVVEQVGEHALARLLLKARAHAVRDALSKVFAHG
jgi:hypothetical protein